MLHIKINKQPFDTTANEKKWNKNKRKAIYETNLNNCRTCAILYYTTTHNI